MKKILLAIFLSVLISCSGGKKETIDDNVSKEKNIKSVLRPSSETLSKGNKLFLQGDFQKAVEVYQKEVSENRAAAFYNMGVSYFLMDNFQKSAEYFRKTLEEDEELEAARINLVASLIQLNDIESAESIIKKLVEKGKNRKIFVNAANMYLKKGETAKAFHYFNKAESSGEGEMPSYLNSSFGTFLISLGDYEKGINLLENVQNKGFNEYFNLARGYYETESYNKSIKNLNDALSLKKNLKAYDLLAKNYNQVGDYMAESETLRKMLNLKRSEDILYRYAFSLYKSGNINVAMNVLDQILNEFPMYEKAYFLYYDILIEKEQPEEAGRMLAEAYKKIKKPSIAYLYAKHLILETENQKAALDLLNNAGESDYITLGKALYNLSIEKINEASSYLKQINELKISDYYAYNTFAEIKKGNYSKAEIFADKISEFDKKYFWYNFVIAWNTDNYNKVREIAKIATENTMYYSQNPEITVKLDPVIEDLDFSYYFNGKYEDFLKTMLVPVMIEPQQMIEFLALGYRLLSENEKVKALEELKKSVNISEALKYNNIGTNNFMQRDFGKALEYYQKADRLIQGNPVIQYNLGLVHLNKGSLDKAFDFFDQSILTNKFVFPSFLGKSIILEKRGEKTKSLNQYEQLLSNINKYTSEDKEAIIPGIFLYSEYFAKAGLGRYNEVISDVATDDNPYEYMKAIARLAEHMKNSDINAIEKISEMNVFRKDEILYLLKRLKKPFSVEKKTFDDSYITMTDNYLTLKSGEKNFTMPEKINKFMLKDFVYYNVYTGDMDNALKHLQRLSNEYFRFGDLYKASLYYYLVKRDFTNSEASISAMNNLDVKGIFADYYKILYYLLNFQEKRLSENIKNYIENYPVDYRGIAADALLAFMNGGHKKLYNDIVSLNLVDENFLTKVPMELEIESL